MNVIDGAVDDNGRAAHFTDDAAEIGEEVGADFGFDQRPTVLGAKDQMDHNVSAGLSQGFFRPVRARVGFTPTQGLRPGLHSDAALRLFDCRASPPRSGNVVPNLAQGAPKTAEPFL